MLETIKSYLVSLGFSVDQNSYNDATKAMDNAGKVVSKFASGAVSKFALAGVAVSAFVTTAVTGLAMFVSGLAKADLQNDKLARQMWMSKENAEAYNNTLKAMGATLQDLYLSPELMRNFQLLREQANNMRAPDEYYEQMKLIRSIQFEFTRFKLEASYALQWIGYYFIKYMSGPIQNIKLTLNEINGIIVKTMPSWTKVVAQVMSWFAQFGITTVRAIKDLIHVFDEIGQAIPKNVKLIGAALAGLGLIIETGPIGIITTLLVAAILLLNDFYTYLDGGESQFGPFWAKLEGMGKRIKAVFEEVKETVQGLFDDLKDNGTLDHLKESFENTMGIIKLLFDDAKTWVDDLWKKLGDSGVLTDLKGSFEHLFEAVSNVTGAVTGLIKEILGLDGTKDSLKGIGGILNDTIIVALEIVNGLVKSIAEYMDKIASIIRGNFVETTKKEGQEAEKRLEQNSNEKEQGYWERMGTSLKEMMTDTFTGKTNFSDKILRLGGRISDLMGPNKTNSKDYMYPSSSNQTNHNNVTLQQTNNIYGSDPKATADAAHNNMYGMYMRNFRGGTR